jgi:hypothetical protein
MGMTNRVIPAQGEERGASFTLIGLDGDTARKFQPHPQHFFGNIYNNVLCGMAEAGTLKRPSGRPLNRQSFVQICNV